MYDASRSFSLLTAEAKIALGLLSLISVLFILRTETETVRYQIITYGTSKLPCDDKFDISKIEVVSWHPRIFRYRNFLSIEECDHLIKKGVAQGLSRSKVAAPEQSEANDARTSYGTFIEDDADIVIRGIEERISQWTQIPAEHGENIYLLRYEVGQEYKPHHDFFHKTLDGVERYIGKSGQRTATVLMYIEAPISGGETFFPTVNITEPVERGSALLFFSTTPDLMEDMDSLHGSNIVTNGTKWCATKWLRMSKHHERKPLP